MNAAAVVSSMENKGARVVIAPGAGGKAETHNSAPSPEDTAPVREKLVAMSERAEQETREKIEKIGEMMDAYVRSSQTSLSIRVDGHTGRTIVKVISKEDGRVIREIPAEEAVQMAAKMEEMAGLLFDRKV
jgi:flagellar protein FlaG